MGDVDSIHGWKAKIPHASWPKTNKQTNKQTNKKTHTHKQSIKQEQYCNKFNKDFKNGPHQKKS